MCGIAGIVSFGEERDNRMPLEAMSKSIAHRGPDGANIFLNEPGGVASVGLAHRRLAIIDLSEKAAQPMCFQQRYQVIYNGEIYNYTELKNLLQQKAVLFHTNSDTEVIVAAYHTYGTECLQHFDGMFAFAIWDEQENTLFCARDRFGEKPFYYHYNEEKRQLTFASEMKALWAAGIQKKADLSFLFQYITTGQPWIIFQPERSGYESISQLPAAHYMVWNMAEINPSINAYFDLDKQFLIDDADDDIINNFRTLFDTSITRRLRSDVAIGTSLSGGIDSTAIIAASGKLKNTAYSHTGFSAIFPGFEKDESTLIDLVANKFSIQSHCVKPDAEGLVEEIEKVFYHQEIPFGSSSVYAQYKVFELAQQKNIKVLFDGQGADEIAGGYPKYTHWYLQERFNSMSNKNVQKEAESLRANNFLAEWGLKNYVASKLPGLVASVLERRLAARQRSYPLLHPAFKEAYYDRKLVHKPAIDTLNDVLYFDTMHGGLKELLHYADRNSMAFGREVRLPFLNHKLVEFLFSVPSFFKFRNGYSKWIIREAFKNELPVEILWRKGKTGFEPPQKEWMRDKKVQEKIIASKKILVDNKILSPRSLKKEITPSAAYDKNNADWRFWMAGLMLKEP